MISVLSMLGFQRLGQLKVECVGEEIRAAKGGGAGKGGEGWRKGRCRGDGREGEEKGVLGQEEAEEAKGRGSKRQTVQKAGFS